MLKVDRLSFSYNGSEVLSELSFTVNKGEHLAVIGESGSGKTTLLKLLYGEFDLNQGSVHWNNKQILGPKFNLVVGYDFMKYVAQEFDLMPFISVEENVGKFLSNFFPEEKQRRTQELIEVVELTEYSKTKVKHLSGGQKQRVALARALAKEPEILLLDEPFSHIDNFKKQSLRRRLFNYLKANDITCIVATHDKNDVLGFADHMLLLHQQKIQVMDTPENLYKTPQSPLVASFFGEFNQINDQIIYANQIKVVNNSELKGIVKQSYFSGSHYLIEVDVEGNTVFLEHNEKIEEGATIFLSIEN
ncbi:MAG: ABC transporter ATP-binding protein [Psychroserpens sp.]|nr:ABC transporter ATP-binding protein [Psychroserpens sp.]